MTTKKIYFASDFHLGAPNHLESRKREDKIIRWLNTVSKDASDIYLVGDVFDFWFEYKYTIPKGYVRFLGKLAELIDHGIKIHLFTGNHDMWMFDYLEKEIGVSIYRNLIEIEINGFKLLIGHGDGLGPGDNKYKVIKKFFANPICQWLFARVHPNLGFYIAQKWSKKSREKEIKGDHHFLGEEKEWLVQFCKEKLKSKNINYFIFGHRHLPIEHELNKESKYINLGDWINHNTYGVFHEDKMELKKFI
jgi:UDP-2,3-diacylglucosamine hydrolase